MNPGKGAPAAKRPLRPLWLGPFLGCSLPAIWMVDWRWLATGLAVGLILQLGYAAAKWAR